MYYEEKVIDGKTYWRSSPTGGWRLLAGQSEPSVEQLKPALANTEEEKGALTAKLVDTANALRISRLHAESLEREVADLRHLRKKLEEVEQALFSETHLAESRLITISKLKKRLRKVDGPITEGSALDRVHEFISTVNERLQRTEARCDDLYLAIDDLHDRINGLATAESTQAITALTTRLNGRESAYDSLRKDVLHG